jgi:hypothetical protein
MTEKDQAIAEAIFTEFNNEKHPSKRNFVLALNHFIFSPKNQELSDLQAKYEALEKENFKLAAYQCNTPVTDEHGSLICKEKTVLYANNSLLQAKYDKLKHAFQLLKDLHLDEQPFDKSKTAFHRVWDIQAGLID